MKIALIGVPMYYGCDNPGTERAYEALLQAGLVQCLEKHGNEVVSCQTVREVPVRDKYFDPSMEYLQEVQEMMEELTQMVRSAMEQGYFPLMIGGDHALGIGSLAGVSYHVPQEDLSVVWVDAHTDINTPDGSPSHHIHGMPLAVAIGEGDPALTGIGARKVKVDSENLFFCGARSIDPPEWALIQERDIRCFTMQEIRQKGCQNALEELVGCVKTPYLHLSFDVDGLDAALFHATGLPIPNGFTIQEACSILQRIVASGKVCSMDVVEYSPRADEDGQGLRDVMTILDAIGQALAQVSNPMTHVPSQQKGGIPS